MQSKALGYKILISRHRRNPKFTAIYHLLLQKPIKSPDYDSNIQKN